MTHPRRALTHAMALASALASPALPSAGAESPVGIEVELPAATSASAGLPVTLEARLRNHGATEARLQRPDGWYSVVVSVRARGAPAPTAVAPAGAPFEQPVDVVRLKPGEVYPFEVRLDRGTPGLANGDYDVTVTYQPRSRHASWATSPGLPAKVEASSQLRVIDPDGLADRAALATVRGDAEAYWGETPAPRPPPVGEPSPGLRPRPGELVRLLDAAGAAELVVEADGDGPDLLAAMPRLARDAAGRLAVGPAQQADVTALTAGLNALIDGPLLEVLRDDPGRSPAAAAMLGAAPPEFDRRLANRLLLEDRLPGCLPATLARVAYDWPESPYAAVALAALAKRYYYDGDVERGLLWWTRLQQRYPAEAGSSPHVRFQFDILLAAGRLEEAETLLRRLHDGRQHAAVTLAARRRREAEARP